MSIYELQANVHILVISVILLFPFPKKNISLVKNFFLEDSGNLKPSPQKTNIVQMKEALNNRGPT